MQRTLLIVDDIATNREILKKILGDEYAALEAENGLEALEIMRREFKTLSAVLLDLAMPVMDGFELLSRIQGDAQLSHLPVIVTTGQTEVESEVMALTLGANDYIAKPYNSTIIKQRIRNTINLCETAAAMNSLQRDKLTGLFSREIFFEKAQEMLDAHPAAYYVMASFDIENFKVINDQYGMEKGDQVLKNIAVRFERFTSLVGGLCCRISADNFALIYPSEFMDSKTLLQCRKAASSPLCLDRPISIRTGRYVASDLSISANAMYDRAVIAEVSIKGRYDVDVAYYDESMRLHILREQEIINEMKDALSNDQFEVFFQPQFNHKSAALVGAEALVRWRHPQKGLIGPDAFVPVFERNGFIYEMDQYVWESCCRCLRKWLDAGESPLPVSVNISRYDLFREDLVENIVRLVELYRLPSALLRLEITESAFAGASEKIIRVVCALKERGFVVEIDDFGSGYSSLNTLKDVPADILKLDMRFLEGSRNSERGSNILESIVSMARRLRMPVIAEGVETAAQADFLASIGCCYIQGYLYARAMSEEEYEGFVKKHKSEPELFIPEAPGARIAEENLRRACEERYGALMPTLLALSMETTDNLSFAKDISFRYLCGSRAFICMTGLKNENELIGKTDYDIFDKATADGFRADDQRLMESGESLIGIIEAIPSNDGVQHYSATSKYLLRNSADEIVGIYGVGRDVTEYRRAFEQLALLNETLPAGIASFEITPEGLRNTYFNEGFYGFSGYTREEYAKIIESDPMGLVFEEDRAPLREMLRALRSGETDRGDCIFRSHKKDGGYRYFSVRAIAAKKADGVSRMFNMVQYDITERRLAEEKLRMSEEQYRIAMAQCGTIMCRYDVADHSINMSPEVAAIFNMPEKVAGVPYAALRMGIVAAGSEGAYVDFFEGILRGEKSGSAEFEQLTTSGWRCLGASYSTIFSDDGEPVYAVVSFVDNTEARRRDEEYAALLISEQTLREKADTDGLTGLCNRTAAEARIKRRLSVQKGVPCALLIVDIDDLKYINDSFGHPEGDRAIRLVAELLESQFRRSDVIGRVGGDEFIVLLDGPAEQVRISELLLVLIERIGAHSIGGDYALRVSIGATIAENAQLTFDQLYAQADKALYNAKRGGKGRFVFYSPESGQ